MERDNDTPATVELGSVSTDTRGAMGEMIEPIGFWHMAGIEDE